MVKRSCFAITINSQQESHRVGKEKTREIRNRLKSIYETMAKSMYSYLILPQDFKNDDIKDIQFQAITAVGKSQSKIHSHGILCIDHNTNVRLDYRKVQNLADQKLGYRCHFDAKILRTDEDIHRWKSYMYDEQ